VNLIRRFKMLSLWNKLGVLGSITSLAALIPATVIWLSSRQLEKEMAERTSNFLSQGDQLLEQGQLEQAQSVLNLAPDKVKQNKDFQALLAVVDGFILASSSLRVDLLDIGDIEWRLENNKHPYTREVRLLLEFRCLGPKYASTFFRAALQREGLKDIDLHPYTKLFIGRAVHVEDPEWARDLFDSVIASTHNSKSRLAADAFYWKGFTYQSSGNYAEACIQFSNGLERVPDGDPVQESRLLERLANTYRNLGNATTTDSLIAKLGVLVSRGPADSKAIFQLAIHNWRQKNSQAARHIIEPLLAEARNPVLYNRDPYIYEYYRVCAVIFEIDSGVYERSQETRLKLSAEAFHTMPSGPFDETAAWAELYLAKHYHGLGRLRDAQRAFTVATGLRYARSSKGQSFWPEDEWQDIGHLIGAVPQS